MRSVVIAGSEVFEACAGSENMVCTSAIDIAASPAGASTGGSEQRWHVLTPSTSGLGLAHRVGRGGKGADDLKCTDDARVVCQ